jgi:hypothetical protein
MHRSDSRAPTFAIMTSAAMTCHGASTQTAAKRSTGVALSISPCSRPSFIMLLCLESGQGMSVMHSLIFICGRNCLGSVVAAAGWFETGNILGVALDLDTGTLLASVNGTCWVVACPNAIHTSPCCPSGTAGSALFPAMCGGGGARLRCNWGGVAGRPMRHCPPSGQYLAVGLIAMQVLFPFSASLPGLPPLHSHVCDTAVIGPGRRAGRITGPHSARCARLEASQHSCFRLQQHRVHCEAFVRRVK